MLTLIGRRSRNFAGARFLRRGLDARGNVANEVETELLVSYSPPAASSPSSPRAPPPSSQTVAPHAAADSMRPLSHSEIDPEYRAFFEQPEQPSSALSTSPDTPPPVLPSGPREDSHDNSSDRFHHNSPSNSRIASFCMLRGSVPLFWAQEDLFSPQRAISLHLEKDPAFTATRAHLDGLVARYGAPVLCLNLIRQEEKTPRERILAPPFIQALRSLAPLFADQHPTQPNFPPNKLDPLQGNGEVIPDSNHPNKDDSNDGDNNTRDKDVSTPAQGLFYVAYDFLAAKQGKNDQKRNVVQDLTALARPLVESTGLYAQTFGAGSASAPHRDAVNAPAALLSLQTGVSRVNCVDCLDRTNVALAVLARVALSKALVTVVLDSDCVPIWLQAAGPVLQGMFARLGDRVAYQYAGSGALHQEVAADGNGSASASQPVSASINGDEDGVALSELSSDGREQTSSKGSAHHEENSDAGPSKAGWTGLVMSALKVNIFHLLLIVV